MSQRKLPPEQHATYLTLFAAALTGCAGRSDLSQSRELIVQHASLIADLAMAAMPTVDTNYPRTPRVFEKPEISDAS